MTAAENEDPCSICAMIEKGVEPYFSDENWIAMPPNGARPAWAFLATKRHSEWTWGMSPEEAATFGPITARLSDAIRKVSGVSRVYIVGFGENTKHCHFLFIPRIEELAGDMRAAIRKWGAAADDAEGFAKVSAALRQELTS